MDKFAKLTGRQYHLFDYEGAPDAERIVVLMGSGAEAVHETVEYLTEKERKSAWLKFAYTARSQTTHLLTRCRKQLKLFRY